MLIYGALVNSKAWLVAHSSLSTICLWTVPRLQSRTRHVHILPFHVHFPGTINEQRKLKGTH